MGDMLVPILVPIIVIALSTLIFTKRIGSARICPAGGFSICRGWHKMFFGIFFLIVAGGITFALYLDAFAETARKACTIGAFAGFLVSLLFFIAYYICKLDIKNDRFIYTNNFGMKTNFALADIRKVKFSPSLFRIVLYTDKGTIRVDGYMRDAWYLIELLRKAEIPGISFAAEGFYAHRQRPSIFYKNYAAYADRATDVNIRFTKMISDMLRNYEICAIDCPENTADLWKAVHEALLKARVTGEHVSLVLASKLRRFAIDHEDCLTDEQINSVRDLCYDAKYDVLYKSVLESVGIENTYSRKDFIRVMYYLEATMGCPPEDILFNNMGKNPDLMSALYPATDTRPYDVLCSVGVGARKMRVPNKQAEHLARCEIALPLMPGTYKDTDSIVSRLDRYAWFSHPHVAENGPTFIGPGMIFGDGEDIAYDGEPYHYLLFLYMAGKYTSILHLGKKKLVHFYQITPLYKEEAKIWNEGEGFDEFLKAIDYPNSSALPNRPEITYDEFYGKDDSEETDGDADSRTMTIEEFFEEEAAAEVEGREPHAQETDREYWND